MRTISMLLPYSKPPLSLNDRGHYMARARKVAQVRRDVYLIARSHNLPTGLDHVTVQLHYPPAHNRRRDPINLSATHKALVDGLAAGTKKHPGYGLVPDDDPRYVTDLMPVIHPSAQGKPAQMWLVLEFRGEAKNAG